jgi:hypothetical protein
MRTADRQNGNTKGQKRDSGGPLDQNQQANRKQTASHGSRGGPKRSNPDKHGGSGAGRQQGGSGVGRER